MVKPVKIHNKLIGPGHPCFVVAEAGVNHNGDVRIAHQLIDTAVRAGADAIKFQSFVTEDLITREAQKADYQLKATGLDGTQYEMLKALELNAQDHYELKRHCEQKDIVYLCTPYESKSVDMLHELDVSAFKIASTDTNNIPFLRYIADKGRPVILSTGMANLGEVENALDALGGLVGNIIIMHCTSEYPAPVNDSNLKAIITLQEAFRCPVGFSDHTAGVEVSTWAVAIGASVIEKHFTLDSGMEGPDHRASMEPDELIALVQAIRSVEIALGDGIKRPMPSEILNRKHMRKSLVANRNIGAGEVVHAGDLVCKRPGTGLEPFWMGKIVGQKTKKNIQKDELIDLSEIDWN